MGKKQTFESYSSNINEVIKTVLNFFFFLQKDFTSTANKRQSTKPLTANKNKKCA